MNLFHMRYRNFRPELMDDPSLDSREHLQALQGLERINAVSLVAQSLWTEIRKLAKENPVQPLQLLDIATGAGDLPVRLMKRAGCSQMLLQADGCDISSRAVAYAREKATKEKVPSHFFTWSAFIDPVPPQYDILTSALFLHHLSEEQLVLFLKKLREANPKMILLSDLCRSPLGFMTAAMGSHIFSRSRVIHEDALQSVRAAFTLAEITQFAQKAGWQDFELRPLWPFRYLLIWKK